MNVDELRQVVEENTDTDTSGKSSVRMDAEVVVKAKSELGISQNTDLAPFAEAAILQALELEEAADEKLEEFRNQFED